MSYGIDPETGFEIEYITELEEEPVKSSSFINDTKLEYTEKIDKDKKKKYIYQLVNVNVLESEKYKNIYHDILKLILNNNKLSTITLKGYNKLEILNASNNHISQVNLCLPALRELNLSRNYIKKIFELLNLPNLRKLYLSQNSITDISFDSFRSVKKTLSYIDLSENLIDFNEVKEFFSFCENFGPYMKELTTLNLTGNPFTIKKKYKDTYQSYIVYTFPKLQILNGRMTSNIVKKSVDKNPNYSSQLKSLKERMMNLEVSENVIIYNNNNLSYKKNEQVTLKEINEELLKINQLGRLNDRSFEKLSDMIEIYINNMNIASDNNEDTELDDFEIFLDYIEKIIDGVSGYEKRLYSAIGNFATIKYGKFASRALSCLKQRITNQNANDLIEVITNISIFLKQTNEENIPCSVIDSLQVFIDEPQLLNLMKIILRRIMDIGLKIGNNINYRVTPGRKGETNIDVIYLNLFNSVIGFVTKCIQLESNSFLNDIIENDEFINLCNNNVKEILIENDDDIVENENELNILTNLLEMIRIICRLQALINKQILKEKLLQQDIEKQNKENEENEKKEENQENQEALPENSNAINNKNKLKSKKQKNIYENFNINLSQGGTRDRIEQKLNILLQSVFKNSNQKESEEISLRKKIYNKKMECKSLMQCYGALLGIAQDVVKFLDNSSLLMKIIDILGQNEIICPIIFSGACDCTYYTIENEKINQDQSKFMKICGKLYDFRYLIPLLFTNTKEFNKICTIADQYGERTLERGKPIDLRYMDSPIINSLYISLIDLMSFFGENSLENSPFCPIGKICSDIASEMNKLNRDNGLANALFLPNEDVKLSVVKCYYGVKVEELEPEEIASIYRQLGYISTIAGKFQVIIAIIFLILNKWFLYHLGKKNIKNIDTCKEAIFMGIDLLSKVDFQKNAIEKENHNKILMSGILIVFLINVSNFKETKNYFSDPKNANQIMKLLVSEEESVNYYKIGVPLEIEKCHCGWVINNLIPGIKSGSLNPYNYISLRILIHLGDILENKKYPFYELNYNRDCLNIMEDVKKMIIERECERIDNLSKNWRKSKEGKKKREAKYSIELTYEEQKNEQKAFIENFRVFLGFILGQCSKNQIADQNRIENLFCKDIDNINYSLNHSPYSIGNDGKKGSYEENNENSDNEDEDNVIENNVDVYELFKSYLREEDYNSGNKNNLSNYNYIQNDLMNYSVYDTDNKIMVVRDKKEETPNNRYLRTLFVSAFFRCIYGVLKYGCNKSIKLEMIKRLYEGNNIKILCQLAESTKFIDKNIATKILIIMRYVLSHTKDNDNDEGLRKKNKIKKNNDMSKREDDNIYLNIIGKISYIIRKVIKIQKKEFNIENDDHKLLLSEICKCSKIIITELQSLNFISEKIKETTIKTMINYEIIQVFIEAIKEYMNKPFQIKGENEKENKSAQLLNKMIETMALILGEYMSRVHSRKYDILEAFTLAYTFERCHMRKTFIKEIIEVSKMSNLKVCLNRSEKNIKFFAPCLITNCNAKSTETRLLFINDKSIGFFEISNFDQIFNMATFSKIENSEILIDNIIQVLQFDYQNRVIIQTRNNDNEFSFFFHKMNLGRNMIKTLRSLNKRIKIYYNVPIFTQMDIKNLPPLIEEENKQNETPSEEKLIDYQSKNIIISCGYEYQGFCCDFFPSLFSKSEQLQDAKVIVIGNGQLKIFLEKFDVWDNVNANLLFDQLNSNKIDGNRMRKIMTFENYFEEIADTWNLSDFSGIKLVDADYAYIYDKNGKPIINLKIYDDMSYVKLREGLNIPEIFDDFDNE